MGVSFTARLWVGFLVEPGDLFVDALLPPACPKGHAPKAGEAFCPIDGGRFEARVERAWRQPVAAYLERLGLKAHPDSEDGPWQWFDPLGDFDGVRLFDARAHAEPDDRGGKVLALGYQLAEVGLDDGPKGEPRSFWLSHFQADAHRCREAARDMGIAREVDVQVFLTGYTGY